MCVRGIIGMCFAFEYLPSRRQFVWREATINPKASLSHSNCYFSPTLLLIDVPFACTQLPLIRSYNSFNYLQDLAVIIFVMTLNVVSRNADCRRKFLISLFRAIFSETLQSSSLNSTELGFVDFFCGFPTQKHGRIQE